MKGQANSIISGFKNCITPLAFNQPIQTIAPNFNDRILGTFGWLVSDLTRTFPEPDITPAIADDLVKRLADCLSLLDKSGLDAESRLILKHHIEFVLWALRNRDVVNSTEIADAAGKIMVRAAAAAQQASKRGNLSDEVKATLRTIYDTAVRVAGAYYIADQAAHNLIQAGTDLLMIAAPGAH